MGSTMNRQDRDRRGVRGESSSSGRQKQPVGNVPGSTPLKGKSGPTLPKRLAASSYTPSRRYQRRPLVEPKRLRMVREVLETITLTVLLFMVFRFAVQNYRVDGHSMVPTLQDQQYILVDKAAYLFHAPQRGDVIVFAYPIDPTQDYVKRIIGVPGDHVLVDQDGFVWVNGTELHESYISEPTNPYAPTDLVLKADQYFVLGDNRGDSSDSRVWGPVPRQNIIGKASMVYWPLGALHLVPGEEAVFEQVKP